MSEQALFDSMAQQTAEERERRLASARAEAERIVAEAKEQQAREREAALKAVEDELATLAQRSEQRAQAEAAKASLTMRHTVAEEVLDTVQEEIRSLTASDEFPSVLNALLAEVVQAAPDENIVVLVPGPHEDHCREWLSHNSYDKVEVQASKEFWDGAAVQDKARTYRISNTLTGRFAMLEEDARKLCLAKLFGEQG